MSAKPKRRKRPNHRSRQASTRKLLLRDGPRCTCCEVRFTEHNPPTIEHLTPLGEGGSNDLTNLVLLCERCNSGRLHATRSEPHASTGTDDWRP